MTYEVTASYNRELFELTLDGELDKRMGRKHDHDCVYFPTLTRYLTWSYPSEELATVAMQQLIEHPFLLNVELVKDE